MGAQITSGGWAPEVICAPSAPEVIRAPNSWRLSVLISQKEFIESFCKCQFPQKSVNLSIIITHTKDKLTVLCGNGLLQNNL